MKTPQIEDGYTRIANDLLDAFVAYRLSGEEMKVLLFIMRKTYGYKKTNDYIALSQFVDATDMKKSNVVRAIKKLVDKNIVIKKDNKLGINKNNEDWKPLSKKITTVIKKDKAVIKIDKASLSKKSTTKENTTKENYTKEISTIVDTEFGNSDINEVSSYFLEKLKLPTEGIPVKRSRQYWNVLLRESNRGVDGVKMLIDLASEDDFYKNNITSSMQLYYKRINLIARKRGAVSKIAVMPTIRQEGESHVDTYSRN